MNNNKPMVLIAGATGALVVASLVLRFVLLSQFGLPGGWMLYLGPPIGAIGVLILLLRLGLLNFGQSSSTTMQHWQHHGAVQGPAPVSAPPAPKWQRLQELEALRSTGTISDTEYAEKRERLISSI